MANLNKVMLIGRLTRDPETRVFGNGGKVSKFGFATTNRKKNQSTGEWEDDPMFIDVSVFNRGEYGKLADLAEERLRKGHQVFLEGKLVLDQWEDKQTGQKRSKHVLVVDNFQFLEPRSDGVRAGGGGFQRSERGAAPTDHGPEYDEPAPQSGVASSAPDEDNIPF
jgi:single-strand DNA-binding protein